MVGSAQRASSNTPRTGCAFANTSARLSNAFNVCSRRYRRSEIKARIAAASRQPEQIDNKAQLFRKFAPPGAQRASSLALTLVERVGGEKAGGALGCAIIGYSALSWWCSEQNPLQLLAGFSQAAIASCSAAAETATRRYPAHPTP